MKLKWAQHPIPDRWGRDIGCLSHDKHSWRRVELEVQNKIATHPSLAMSIIRAAHSHYLRHHPPYPDLQSVLLTLPTTSFPLINLLAQKQSTTKTSKKSKTNAPPKITE